MADSQAVTPTLRARNTQNSNKRPRADNAGKGSEKKKRLASSSIKTITNIDFDSSSGEEMEEDASGQPPQGDTFKVKRSSQQSATVSVDDLERILDRRFALLATAKQVDGMNAKIEKNEADINEIRHTLRQMNQRMDRGPQNEEGNALEVRSGPSLNARISQSRETSYSISRRSLRIWPIKGETDQELLESFQAFARTALLIGDLEVKELDIVRIRRTRTPRNSTAYLEVCVTFRCSEDRDFLAGKAPDLAPLVDNQSGVPKAGIRMDIPSYLMTTFKDLNSYAYMARKSGSRGTKTHIKHDDATMGLYLEVRLSPSSGWLRISPEKARELIAENTSEERRALQRTLRNRPVPAQSQNSWDGPSTSVRSSSSAHAPGGWSPPPRTDADCGPGRR